MSLKHGILGLLSYGDMTGYDLSKYFNQSLNFFWQAQRSQIYRDLKNLAEKNLVTTEKVLQEGKPDKKVYSLTNKGEEKLVDWINQYSIEEALKTRNSFLMRIFFSAKGDKEKLQQALEDYIEQNQAQLNQLETTEEEFITQEQPELENEQLYWQMTIKKGYYDYKANIEWAKDILAMLNNS